MNDKKLLELAAKAAGYFCAEYNEHTEKCWCVPYSEKSLITEWDCITSGRHKFEGTSCFMWAPLIDDGDALRLAVKLGLVVDCSRPSAGEPFKQHSIWLDELMGNDELTRRAIVRAAAEIGKGMK